VLIFSCFLLYFLLSVGSGCTPGFLVIKKYSSATQIYFHLQVGVVSDYDLLALDSMAGIVSDLLLTNNLYSHIRRYVLNCKYQ
jgi:hypothetical protein